MEMLSSKVDGDLLERVEYFERDVAICEQQGKEVVTCSIQMGVAVARCPGPEMRKHLIFRRSRLTRRVDFKNELAQVSATSSSSRGRRWIRVQL